MDVFSGLLRIGDILLKFSFDQICPIDVVLEFLQQYFDDFLIIFYRSMEVFSGW